MAICVAIAAMLFSGSGVLFAEAPQALHYQGYLTDGDGNAIDETVEMEFRLYEVENGGEAFWNSNGAVAVDVDNGVFRVALGPLSAAEFLQGSVWLGITILPEQPGELTQEMEPRLQVLSVPYSLVAERAGEAESLSGFDPAAYATSEWVQGHCISADDLLEQLAGYCTADQCGGLNTEELEQFLIENGYVTEQNLAEGEEFVTNIFLTDAGYLTEDSLADWLLANGYNACECYGDADVSSYLDEHGYVDGPHFSGNYSDLQGLPDLDSLATEDEIAASYCPLPCYGDADVQLLMAEMSVCSSPCFSGNYSDLVGQPDISAFITFDEAALSFCSTPCYGNDDVQSHLDQHGYVSGPHLSVEDCLNEVEQAGYLKDGFAISADMLPPDGLDEVSNDVLTTSFHGLFAATDCPQNVPEVGIVSSTINVPDMGAILDAEVAIQIEHSAPEQLLITLVAPTGHEVVLHDHGEGQENGVFGSFDDELQPVEGSLAELKGLSPAGSWVITVIDDKQGLQGQFATWSIEIESLSASKVLVNGSLEVESDFQLAGSAVTRSSLETLTDGPDSSADALHTHADISALLAFGYQAAISQRNAAAGMGQEDYVVFDTFNDETKVDVAQTTLFKYGGLYTIPCELFDDHNDNSIDLTKWEKDFPNSPGGGWQVGEYEAKHLRIAWNMSNGSPQTPAPEGRLRSKTAVDDGEAFFVHVLTGGNWETDHAVRLTDGQNIVKLSGFGSGYFTISPDGGTAYRLQGDGSYGAPIDISSIDGPRYIEFYFKTRSDHSTFATIDTTYIGQDLDSDFYLISDSLVQDSTVAGVLAHADVVTYAGNSSVFQASANGGQDWTVFSNDVPVLFPAPGNDLVMKFTLKRGESEKAPSLLDYSAFYVVQ